MGVLWNPNSTGTPFTDGALVTGVVRAYAGLPSDVDTLDRTKYRKEIPISVLDPAPAEAAVLDLPRYAVNGTTPWENPNITG